MAAVCLPVTKHDHAMSLSRNLKCIVNFLDNTEASFEIDKKDKGQWLLEQVYEHLELHETEYFGLLFRDVTNPTDQLAQHQCTTAVNNMFAEDMRWLDPVKPIRKQMRGAPYVLYFRVKFYVPDPTVLREEYTRYQFFLQLSKDMSAGRLVAPLKTTILLASLAVQSELGDFCPEEHGINYLQEFSFVPNQSDDLLREVAVMHKKHRGLSPATCEKLYIDTARYLTSYGVHLFPATWDQNNEEIQLGVTSQGLAVFQNSVRTNTFNWSKIMKISFKRKQFFIHQRKESSENVENVYGFNMASYRSCKNLWKSCVEYHTFFCARSSSSMLPATSKPVDRQTQDLLDLRSLESQPSSGSNGTVLPCRIVECRTCCSNSRPDVDYATHNSSCHHPPLRVIPPTPVAVSTATECHQMAPSLGALDMADIQNAAASSAASHYDVPDGIPHSHRTSPCTVFQRAPANGIVPVVDRGQILPPPASRSSRLHDVGFTSTLTTLTEQQSTWKQSSSGDGDVAGVTNMLLANDGCRSVDNAAHLMASLPRTGCQLVNISDKSSSSSASDIDPAGALHRDQLSNRVPPPTSACISSASIDMRTSFTDSEKSPTEQSYELPTDSTLPAANEVASLAGHNLVTIRMKPDESGRFGFNVKGGSDQSMPVIVSRVAPNTPSDLCIPRLSEGDQVLFINGRDISQHTHAQVVQFIRASCELHSGELVLVVRQNVYLGDDDSPSEPDFQYIPDTLRALTSTHGDPLAVSMTLLRDAVDNGMALTQFEQLYRKKPGMTLDIAQRPENLPKNRYRDISPYDQTRVKLKALSHDYINANFVNMEIPGSGIVNRYIAAQGPLPETSADFWQMIWDQCSSLVVMLTTNVERGRVKCHQYWPDVGKTVQYGIFTLSCLTENSPSSSFVSRTFSLTNSAVKDDVRQVCQMQYLSWPDHGVPDDCSDFLDFVAQVRINRAGVVEPTIVHCSAGIGRTGVLIAMETAMCLIEANQPVNLPDIVRQMRDQRAMLIQTSGQYKFVCEAVLKVHDEHIVVPVDEFKS